MKVEIQKELAERKPLAEIVKAATPVLEDALGPPGDRITAVWGFRPDAHGRPMIHLLIKDHSEQADTQFKPEDLQPPEDARRYFYLLLGDLLRKSSRKNMERLNATVADELEI
jgi:hypothetical protein